MTGKKYAVLFSTLELEKILTSVFLKTDTELVSLVSTVWHYDVPQER